MEETQGHIGVRTTELMQDDVVLLNGKPVWVKAILDYDEVMVAETVDSDNWEKVYAIELEPAELNEAGLRMLGFEKVIGNKYIQPKASWNGRIEHMGGGYWYCIGREALYYLPSVHSLQHVLRLAGAKAMQQPSTAAEDEATAENGGGTEPGKGRQTR